MSQHVIHQYLLHDIWMSIILPYLEYSEAHPLASFTKSQRLRLIQSTIEYRLEKLLGVERWKTFHTALVKGGGAIAGSWPYQVVVGHEFKDSKDIDVFQPVEEKEVKNYRSKHRGALPSTYVSHLEEELYNHKSDFTFTEEYNTRVTTYNCHELGDQLVNVRSYWINNESVVNMLLQQREGEPLPRRARNPDTKTIQVIQVKNPGGIHDWIHAKFDFDICKISYCPSDVNEPVRIPHDFDRVMNRQCKFNYTTNLSTSVGRYNRYKQRGIVFDPIDGNAILSK